MLILYCYALFFYFNMEILKLNASVMAMNGVYDTFSTDGVRCLVFSFGYSERGEFETHPFLL